MLHHTPKIREILKFVIPKMSENGIARLMLYSDRGFLKYINSDLPDYREDITNSRYFKKMYKHFDTVGNYADWYSKEKIQHRLVGLYEVVQFEYITDDDRFCFVDLIPNCKED